MEMKFGLQMRQTQRLVMTPKLQQALKLLQVPTLELQQILKQEILQNPMLEEIEDVAAELRLAFGLLDDPEYLHAPYMEQNAHLLELFSDGKTQLAAQTLEGYLNQSERMVLAVYARRIE